MRMRTIDLSVGQSLDTNRCSWSDGAHDEHTFEVLDAKSGPMSQVVVPTGGAGVQRRRRHTTYRKAESGASVFRPGTPAARHALGSVGHRTRPTLGGCGDPRATARAAALRRRHMLLAVTALALLVALASPWSSGGGGAPSASATTPSALSAHSVYTVQPGDTLWSIALRLDPQGDPRPVVSALSAEVGSDTVRPGERLRLP
jgi:hypothetical protein